MTAVYLVSALLAAIVGGIVIDTLDLDHLVKSGKITTNDRTVATDGGTASGSCVPRVAVVAEGQGVPSRSADTRPSTVTTTQLPPFRSAGWTTDTISGNFGYMCTRRLDVAVMIPNVDFDPSGSSLLVAGVATALVSTLAAAWMFSLGDIVTALGLISLVAAGLLLAGIDLSPNATPP